MRRRNLCPGFGLPVAASHQVRPSSPSSRSSPLFFFSFSAIENGKILLRCGVGEKRSREQLRRRLVGEQEDHPTQNDVLLLPVLLLFFFFFLFWPSKMEKSRAAASSGRGGARAAASSDRRGRRRPPNPKRRRFGLV